MPAAKKGAKKQAAKKSATKGKPASKPAGKKPGNSAADVTGPLTVVVGLTGGVLTEVNTSRKVPALRVIVTEDSQERINEVREGMQQGKVVTYATNMGMAEPIAVLGDSSADLEGPVADNPKYCQALASAEEEGDELDDEEDVEEEDIEEDDVEG